MQILSVCQFVVTVLNFVAARVFLTAAISGFMLIILMMFAEHTLSYQLTMIILFTSIYLSVEFLVYGLTFAQQQTNFNDLSNINRFEFAQAIISFLYYSFLMVFLYYPYKEFKLHSYLKNPAL